jgi:hypothetical protein
LPDIWGYALYGPGRPSKRAQRDVLKSLGVNVAAIGTLWEDEPKTGSGRRKGHLQGRQDLLNNLEPGNTVVVAAPYCLGVGEEDVKWFLAELAKRDVSLITSAGTLHAGPGGDTSIFLAAFKSAQNTAHVRAHRAKPKKRARKATTETQS